MVRGKSYHMVLTEKASEWELGHKACPEDEFELEPPEKGAVGSQGSICFGTLSDGTRVAVKMGGGESSRASRQDPEASGNEFRIYRNEFEMLRKVAPARCAPLPLGFGHVVERVEGEDGKVVEYQRVAIAEEYMPGATLEAVVEDRLLMHGATEWGVSATLELSSICRAISMDLARIDNRGVAWRDGKPMNLMLHRLEEGGPWDVKIIDFGLATDQLAGKSMSLNVLFTLPFSSPEKVDRSGDFARATVPGGQRGDKSILVDVYSLSQIALCMRLVPDVFADVRAFEFAATGFPTRKALEYLAEYKATRSSKARLEYYLPEDEMRPGDRALAKIIAAASAYVPSDRPHPNAMARAFTALSSWCLAYLRGRAVEERELEGYLGKVLAGEIPPVSTFEREEKVKSGIAPKSTAAPKSAAASGHMPTSKVVPALSPEHEADGKTLTVPTGSASRLASSEPSVASKAAPAAKPASKSEGHVLPSRRVASPAVLAAPSARDIGSKVEKGRQVVRPSASSTSERERDLSDRPGSLVEDLASTGSLASLFPELIEAALDPYVSSATFMLKRSANSHLALEECRWRCGVPLYSYDIDWDARFDSPFVAVTDEPLTVPDVTRIRSFFASRSTGRAQGPGVGVFVVCPPLESQRDREAWDMAAMPALGFPQGLHAVQIWDHDKRHEVAAIMLSSRDAPLPEVLKKGNLAFRRVRSARRDGRSLYFEVISKGMAGARREIDRLDRLQGLARPDRLRPAVSYALELGSDREIALMRKFLELGKGVNRNNPDLFREFELIEALDDFGGVEKFILALERAVHRS